MKEGKIQTHNQYVSRDEGLHEDTYTLRHFKIVGNRWSCEFFLLDWLLVFLSLEMLLKQAPPIFSWELSMTGPTIWLFNTIIIQHWYDVFLDDIKFGLLTCFKSLYDINAFVDSVKVMAPFLSSSWILAEPIKWLISFFLLCYPVTWSRLLSVMQYCLRHSNLHSYVDYMQYYPPYSGLYMSLVDFIAPLQGHSHVLMCFCAYLRVQTRWPCT